MASGRALRALVLTPPLCRPGLVSSHLLKHVTDRCEQDPLTWQSIGIDGGLGATRAGSS